METKGNPAAPGHLRPPQPIPTPMADTHSDSYHAADPLQRSGVIAPSGELMQQLQSLQAAHQELQLRHAALKMQATRTAAELAAAQQEMLSLLYTVSHDFRGPLNTIDGFTQLLERALPAEGAERPRTYATRIKSGVKQMAQLIDALLVLSRAAHSPMKNEAVDLSATAQAIITRLQATDPARQSRLSIADGMVVQGDTRLLSAALEYLLDNAWKFSAGTAVTDIRFEREPEPDAAGNTVYVVRDQGAGFDMARADKLFGAFQRVHGPDEFPGMGMGLAIARKVIERHGGHIRAESAPGKGAAFFFTLPGQPQPA